MSHRGAQSAFHDRACERGRVGHRRVRLDRRGVRSAARDREGTQETGSHGSVAKDRRAHSVHTPPDPRTVTGGTRIVTLCVDSTHCSGSKVRVARARGRFMHSSPRRPRRHSSRQTLSTLRPTPASRFPLAVVRVLAASRLIASASTATCGERDAPSRSLGARSSIPAPQDRRRRSRHECTPAVRIGANQERCRYYSLRLPADHPSPSCPCHDPCARRFCSGCCWAAAASRCRGGRRSGWRSTT